MPNLGNTITTIAIIYIITATAITWLSAALWTLRDIRARSRDTITQLITTTIVTIIPIPGIIIYILLRPKETLSEAYERSLEEEALLQEIEDKPTCPGCGNNIKNEWQICAFCHTQLKQPCLQCQKLLQLTWNICPYCTTSQNSHTHTYQQQPIQQQANPRISLSTQQKTTQEPYAAENLEFIEGEDF